MSDPGGRYSGGEASGSSSAGDSAVSAGHAVLSDGTPSAGSVPPGTTARPRARSRRRWRAALCGVALAVIVAGAASSALAGTYRPLQAAVLPWLVRTPAELAASNAVTAVMENSGR